MLAAMKSKIPADLGQQLKSRAHKAKDSYLWAKGRTLAKASGVRGKLTEAGSRFSESCQSNKVTKAIISRFAGTQSISSEVEQLRAQLSGAKTEEQLHSLAGETRNLIGKAGGRLENHTLAQHLEKASQQLEGTLSGVPEAGSEPISGELQQVLAQLDTRSADQELLVKTESELREMEELEQQLRDLHEISKVLHGMVHNQGETVVRLEDAIEMAGLHTHHGVQELDSSALTKNRNQKLKIAIGIALTVLAAIALALIIL